MKNRIMKTLVLDFDGTIADTQYSIIETIQMTLKELQLPLAKKEVIKELIGLPIKDTFEKAANISDSVIIGKAIDIYRKLYNDISLNTVQLFPGVKDALMQIHNSGIIIAVASSKGKDALEQLLKKMEVISYISVILGEQDVIHKKPAPDMVLKILEITGTLPNEALVVGDTTYDIAMGQCAYCMTCGVTYGNHSRKLLQCKNPNYIIDNFGELVPIIQSLH